MIFSHLFNGYLWNHLTFPWESYVSFPLGAFGERLRPCTLRSSILQENIGQNAGKGSVWLEKIEIKLSKIAETWIQTAQKYGKMQI